MGERPEWCTCGDECGDTFGWECECGPHHPSEYRMDQVPFHLQECRVCHAVVKWDYPAHLAWHERRGDLA